jgi:hypothetical protein
MSNKPDTNPHRDSEPHDEHEAAKRRDEALKRALSTPHKPHKPAKGENGDAPKKTQLVERMQIS